VIVVVGSDYADVASGTELSFNAKIAANLGSAVVLVVHGRGRTPPRPSPTPREQRWNGVPDLGCDRRPPLVAREDEVVVEHN
jgi:hypothetical protein